MSQLKSDTAGEFVGNSPFVKQSSENTEEARDDKILKNSPKPDGKNEATRDMKKRRNGTKIAYGYDAICN